MHKTALKNPHNSKEDKKRIQQQISDIETARKLEKKYRVVPENKQFHLDNLKIPKSIKVSFIAIPQQ